MCCILTRVLIFSPPPPRSPVHLLERKCIPLGFYWTSFFLLFIKVGGSRDTWCEGAMQRELMGLACEINVKLPWRFPHTAPVRCREWRGCKVKSAFCLFTLSTTMTLLVVLTFYWLFTNTRVQTIRNKSMQSGERQRPRGSCHTFCQSRSCKTRLLNQSGTGAAPPTCCSASEPLRCHGNQVPCGSAADMIAPTCAVQSAQIVRSGCFWGGYRVHNDVA